MDFHLTDLILFKINTCSKSRRSDRHVRKLIQNIVLVKWEEGINMNSDCCNMMK